MVGVPRILHYVRVVDRGGDQDWDYPSRRGVAARPALPKSSTSVIGASAASTTGKIPVAQYGEYPQTVAPNDVASALEREYGAHRLQTTGKKYTFDGVKYDDYDKRFTPYDAPEYLYNGKKYIRILAKPFDSDSILSNGYHLTNDSVCWIEVQPIDWLVDKKTGIWVAKNALFAGVQFCNGDSYDGKFSKTNIKQYLDKYFVPQMQSSRTLGRPQMSQDKGKNFTAAKRRVAGYGVVVEDEPMSVREQIEFYVKTGKSFMLHGPSGVGKTGRVEAIDPNLTAVPLWNGVLPEDIVGKVLYPSGMSKPLAVGRADGEDAFSGPENHDGLNARGEWVAPDWYAELVKKCNAEPNRQHVLFIDEITNAKPTTQSLIFHIVLKKSISPSKGKLPKNAVVVLAGNDKQDSGAAYNMPSPLFRRMPGHIYLKLNLPEWLEWASEKSARYPGNSKRMNVHPLVSSFLATYPNAFYSAYDEENPPQFAIDPRGWEQVSDIIYDNNNVIRRELLENKIGPDNAAALMAFAREPMLSLDDVVNGNYGPNDIPEGASQRLACALNMRHATPRQVGVVRKFIRENLGAENLAIFDSLWVGGDDERALQISQMANFQISNKAKVK